MRSYKEFMSNQEELRILLTNKMKNNGIGMLEAARQIGINNATLNKFLCKGQNIGFFGTLCKVVNYIGHENTDDKIMNKL